MFPSDIEGNPSKATNKELVVHINYLCHLTAQVQLLTEHNKLKLKILGYNHKMHCTIIDNQEITICPSVAVEFRFLLL